MWTFRRKNSQTPDGAKPVAQTTDAQRPGGNLSRVTSRYPVVPGGEEPSPFEDRQVFTYDTDDGQPFVVPALRLAAAWAWRLLAVAAAVALLFYGLSYVATIVIPLLVALLMSALLAPWVNWMHRKGVPRALATTIAFLSFLVIVAGLFTLVGQQLAVQSDDLVAQSVAGYESVVAWLQSGPFGFSTGQIADAVDQAVSQAVSALQENSSQILGGALAVTGTAGHFIAGSLIALFATFFFLKDGRKISEWLIRLLPDRARRRTASASARGWITLVQYVRVQVLVAFVDAVGISIGAAILGLPLVVPLGILVFLASFVPVIGAVASGLVVVLVALVSQGWVAALIMLAVVVGVQQLENHVLQPFVMGKAVSVHPLGVILAVATGTVVAGVPGALFAVPFVATLNSVVLDLVGSAGTRTADRKPDATPQRVGSDPSPNEDTGESSPDDDLPPGS
ncbi:AI-2E family transporter [Saxibacter everestensis]|uniref:AI-2E family transporter n=1 Tax=Saxibacter everestensis TaxID=2909229 RepID=A0ABY8QX43_9MICO|nr:AI-2E family transporter [Brevibacteriaceae bacterium ZFBP1038]